MIEQETSYLSSTETLSNVEFEYLGVDNIFNLQQFDRINYSTIMFKKCETEYNCISSSTKRNELVIFNSQLNILAILNHEDHQELSRQYFLQWPEQLSTDISDITYCRSNDQFLISTLDACHLYFFNPNKKSITSLGKLSNSLPLRRIHCYHETVYCITGNNFLFEFQFIENYSKINTKTRIELLSPIDYSLNQDYYLLDVACDENYLVIVYSNENDEIHVQSIHRQTKKFHNDLLIDHSAPINKAYIRIESTIHQENFIYLNGLRKYLKTIYLGYVDNGLITSTMHRHKTPTNICFLQDGRLVILYEQPIFLSIHDINTH